MTANDNGDLPLPLEQKIQAINETICTQWTHRLQGVLAERNEDSFYNKNNETKNGNNSSSNSNITSNGTFQSFTIDWQSFKKNIFSTWLREGESGYDKIDFVLDDMRRIFQKYDNGEQVGSSSYMENTEGDDDTEEDDDGDDREDDWMNASNGRITVEGWSVESPPLSSSPSSTVSSPTTTATPSDGRWSISSNDASSPCDLTVIRRMSPLQLNPSIRQQQKEHSQKEKQQGEKKISKEDGIVHLLHLMERFVAHPKGMIRNDGVKRCRHRFFRDRLKRYIIRYDGNQHLDGCYEYGDIVDLVDVQIPEGGPLTRPKWVVRSFMHRFENTCHEYHQYIINEYLLPSYSQCIYGVMGRKIEIVLDGIGEEANRTNAEDEDDSSASAGRRVRNLYRQFLYRSYSNSSQLVLFRLARAFDEISSLEPEEMVQEIAQGIDRVVISAQQDATAPKDFEFDEKSKTLHVRIQCAVLPEISQPSASHLLLGQRSSIVGSRFSPGSPAKSTAEAVHERCFYTDQQYANMIKYVGLFHSRVYALDMLAAMMQLDKFTFDINWLKFAISHVEGAVWNPNHDEIQAFQTCHEFIYRIAKIPKSAIDPDEKVMQSWHIVLFNNKNMAFERILTLTTKAFYVLNFDFSSGKVDEKSVRRYGLGSLYILDAGHTLLNIVTRDKKEGMLTSLLRGKRRSSSIMLRPSRRTYSDVAHPTTSSTKSRNQRKSHDNMDPFTMETNIANSYLKLHSRKRFKAIRKDRERPPTSDKLSEIVTAFDASKSREIIREIAWTIYGCAVYCTGIRGPLPFEDLKVSRPKGSVQSFIYNMLGLGVSTDTKSYRPDSTDWIEVTNPLFGTELESHETDGDSIDERLYHLKLQDVNLRKAANYKVQMRIAGGTAGTIYLALDKSEHKKVAIKSQDYSDRTRPAVDREVGLVLGLNHRNIIKHLDTFIVTSESIVGTEKHLFLVMDYCHTSLETIIREHRANGSRPSRLTILNWLCQICDATHYLHRKKGIIHRDLKPENVLISTTIDDKGNMIRGEEDYMIKLCDFGSATKYGDSHAETSRQPMSVVGTPLFMAPEVIMGKDYDYRSDVYSLGVLILQMLLVTPAGEIPNVFQNLLRDKYFVSKTCKSNTLDPALSNMSYQCCKLNPEERPNIDILFKDLKKMRADEAKRSKE